ncbi:MAG: hypothetical protein ACI8WM_003361 [Burkholderiaceae bacterium]|jgi:hypothetical protein
MTRVLPRTNFHSSTLIRCLADLRMVDSVESESAFAEKLGLWVHFADAITLSAVHNGSGTTLSTMSSESQVALAAVVGSDFDRIQTELAKAITASCSPKAGKSLIQLPIPVLDLPLDLAASYAPYRWFYDAHQRDMESRIAPLRLHVRNALQKVSPSLEKLADLDAALEGILRERENKLLSKIPALLKKHFEYLFRAHQQNHVDTGQPDNPATWVQPTGWLAKFCSDMQTLLLAELELRLQPTMGLVEALGHNNHNE